MRILDEVWSMLVWLIDALHAFVVQLILSVSGGRSDNEPARPPAGAAARNAALERAGAVSMEEGLGTGMGVGSGTYSAVHGHNTAPDHSGSAAQQRQLPPAAAAAAQRAALAASRAAAAQNCAPTATQQRQQQQWQQQHNSLPDRPAHTGPKLSLKQQARREAEEREKRERAAQRQQRPARTGPKLSLKQQARREAEEREKRERAAQRQQREAELTRFKQDAERRRDPTWRAQVSAAAAKGGDSIETFSDRFGGTK